MTVRLLAALALVLACMTMPAHAAHKALPLEQGFQDIPWGADIAGFPNLERIGVKNMAEFYSDPSRSYVVGGVAVTRVVYGVTKGKVFAVYVDLPSQEAFDSLRTSLEKQLGVDKSRLDGATTVWSWRKGPVRVKLKQEQTGARKLALYYEPLAKDVELSIFEKDGDETHRGPTTWFSVKDDSLPTAIPLLRF
ncbi:MAG: hypothetical protein LDL27_10370 [Desulfovibrio sp.]|nr:hypothetical protein [Desulfovibrio sp.]